MNCEYNVAEHMNHNSSMKKFPGKKPSIQVEKYFRSKMDPENINEINIIPTSCEQQNNASASSNVSYCEWIQKIPSHRNVLFSLGAGSSL